MEEVEREKGKNNGVIELITEYEEGEDIIPDKLYTVERLNDYTVYENRFLYMLLCYLRDFISLRYSKIVEATNKYDAVLTLNKEFMIGKEKINYSVNLHDVRQDDEYLKEHNSAKEIIDRIIYSPKEVDKTLLELVGKDKNIKVSFMNNWCYEVDFYERIYFDKVYENLVFKVLKDFIVFSKSSNIANEYLKDLENFDKTLTNNRYIKINNLRYDPIKESFHIEFRISYPFGRKPNKKFESFNGVFSINISSNDISLNYTKKDYFKDEEIKTNLSFFDIMDNNSRFYFIEFFKEFLRYFDMLKKYTNIKETNIIKSIKAFVKIEEDLKDYGLSLDVKNYTYCVEITNNLKIEYNFLLNDFVVEFYNNFYNIENFNIDNDLETLVKKFENIFLEDFKDAKLSLASFFI